MAKWECTICGYIYDEEAEGVKFEDLPDDTSAPNVVHQRKILRNYKISHNSFFLFFAI